MHDMTGGRYPEWIVGNPEVGLDFAVQFEIGSLWAPRLEGPGVLSACPCEQKGLTWFEQVGIYATRVLNTSRPGSQIFKASAFRSITAARSILP